MTRESDSLLFIGIAMVISSFTMYHNTNAHIYSPIGVGDDIISP